MTIYEKLETLTSSVEDLSLFINENNDEIFNFFINQSQSNLRSYRRNTENFLSSSLPIIKKLDLSINENKIFIDILIDTCERLNLSFYFQRLYRIKEQADLSISKRTKATSLYMNGLRNIDDYSNILDDFLSELQNAFELEEDTDKRVLIIFFNFYTKIIMDFTPKISENIIIKIKNVQINYSFLKNSLANDIFLITDFENSEKTVQEIHSILDIYLDREVIQLIYNDAKYLIELETEYASKLKDTEANIEQIRHLACTLDDGLDETFDSLGRGVAILDKEQQLYKYLKSFGKMHFAKCNYAYSYLSNSFFENNISITDWGCGQALASMTYIDFLKKQNIKQSINKITLIEPSEIALKRGSLHIKTMNENIDILTINKDLNTLKSDDFDINIDDINVHLFSNILDIDDYSVKQLTNLVKKQFKGLNYFIIISPKITDLKTNRIDSFIKEFELEDFKNIKSENKNYGEWENSWTIILRIFKVNIK